MSNARKIIILADSANSDSPVDIQNSGPVKFKKGDDLIIEATFLQNEELVDMSAAQKAVLEILDIGAMNSPSPRSVSLLMRKEVEEFGEPVCDSSGKLDLDSDSQSSHAVFKFSNLETQVLSGEKWLSVRVEFLDGSKISFVGGWIFIEENFISDPELLPIENPQYIKREEAGSLFLNKSGNLSDLDSKPLARGNLDVYSKQETNSIISESLEFLPSYESTLNTIKSDAISAKESAQSASSQATQALNEISVIESNLETLEAQAEAAKDLALLAKSEAQAISDPENRIGNLQISKLNIGKLHFSGGGLNGSINPSDIMSVVFTTDYQFPQSTTDQAYFATVGSSVANAGILIKFGADDRFRILANGGFKSYKGSDIRPYINLNNNVICITLWKDLSNNIQANLYVNGNLITAASSSTVAYPTLSNIYIIGRNGTLASPSSFTVQNFYIFNFDVSAEGASYTISDYKTGKSLSPSLTTPTETNHSLLALENYTIANGSTKYVPDVSGNSNDATVSGSVAGDNDIRIAKLKYYTNL